MRLLNLLRDSSRLPQKESKVPFQAILPLSLRNRVSGKGEKSADVACLQEMTVLFACLKSNEFSESICNKEITAMNTCYKASLKEKFERKEKLKKGLIAPGEKRLPHRQLNEYLKKFPNPK